MKERTPREKREFPKIVYILLLATVPVIWGFGFVVTDDALASGAGTCGILAVRFLFAAALLSLFRISLPETSENKAKFTRRDWLWGAIVGAVNFFGFFLQTCGLQYTDPARGGMLTGTYVVLVPIVCLVLYKKFNFRSVANAVVFFIGMLFLVNPNGASGSFYGDALCLACSVFFCAQILLTDRFCGKLNLVNFNVSQMLVMGVLGLVGALLFERGDFSQISFEKAALPLLYLGLFSSAYAYVAQTYAQRKLSAGLTAILLSMESVMSVVFSLACGRTKFTWTLAVGCAVMAAASVSASVFDEKPQINETTKEK